MSIPSPYDNDDVKPPRRSDLMKSEEPGSDETGGYQTSAAGATTVDTTSTAASEQKQYRSDAARRKAAASRPSSKKPLLIGAGAVVGALAVAGGLMAIGGEGSSDDTPEQIARVSDDETATEEDQSTSDDNSSEGTGTTEAVSAEPEAESSNPDAEANDDQTDDEVDAPAESAEQPTVTYDPSIRGFEPVENERYGLHTKDADGVDIIELHGPVPDQETADRIAEQARDAIGVDIVVVKFDIDPDAKAVTGRRVLTNESMQFLPNSSDIDPQFLPNLNLGVAALATFPSVTLRLTGHTDDVGDADANRALSLERVQSVVDASIAAGADPDRLEVFGDGEDFPRFDNSTQEGRDRNRRVESELVNWFEME